MPRREQQVGYVPFAVCRFVAQLYFFSFRSVTFLAKGTNVSEPSIQLNIN